MSDLNTLLTQRLKKRETSSKMADMALQTVQGNLSGFAGIFNVSDLNEKEKQILATILNSFTDPTKNIDTDLEALISITSEIKAINNQAAILHGERIKRAQQVLMNYREGAFSAWLMATYGNRQTPYNFLQYYEFCEALPKGLKPQIEKMPRQAIYTLASRQGPLELKKKIVEDYRGETKIELLEKIRDLFPLAEDDRRSENIGDKIVLSLQRLLPLLKRKTDLLSQEHKQRVSLLLEQMSSLL